MRYYKNLFNLIIDPENLFLAWEIFKRGKKNKPDVLQFEKNLEANIFALHRNLADKAYQPSYYRDFWICDPKRRHIHRAAVRDRILHHAIFRILNYVFDPTFITASFSCRFGQGTHRGVLIVEQMLRQTSRNYTKTTYALKCDIKNFFASVDHTILLRILERRIKDNNLKWLIREIVESYPAVTRERERERGGGTLPFSIKGIPIGNLTSQLFANVYLNEFDQFIKHELKIKNYVRYSDDFIIILESKDYLNNLLTPIQSFLCRRLKLELHPKKVEIRKLKQGIDFLGQIILPHHRRLRLRTKKRMFRKLTQKIKDYHTGFISKNSFQASIQSYLGMLSHCRSHHLSEKLKNYCWLNF